MKKMRIIRHEPVLGTGSFEVSFPDGRPSKYFYWDDVPNRRLRSDMLDSDAARQDAQRLARSEQIKLDSPSRLRRE